MTRMNRQQWFNLGWYQAVWFTAVTGGAPLSGVLLLLLLLHLLCVECWRSELGLMLGCAVPGCVADSLLAVFGVYIFDPVPMGLPIPLWLAAIWLGFGGTLRGSLRWLSARPALMTALAAPGAPLTYLGAQRLGAVEFPLGTFATCLLVGAVWMTLTPLLCWLARRANDLQAQLLAKRQLQSMKEIDHVR